MRFLLDLKDHSELSELFDEHLNRKKFLEERKEFIKKQFDKLKEDLDSEHQNFWETVQIYMESKKLLPEDYSKENNFLEFDKKSKQLFLYDMEENQGHPLEALFKFLGN